MDIFSVVFWKSLNFSAFLLLVTLANLFMFAATALIVFILRRFFIRFDLNHTEQKMSPRDFSLACYVLTANIAVGILGWVALRNGLILLQSKDFTGTALDVFLLMLLIDSSMYFAHFLTHKTFVYKLTHATHHEHESMGLLSLYVMNPLEALGFGLILIVILSVFSIDVTALLIFLFLNWILGVFAHSGIEPSKGQWANFLCMTRFHQIHHENPKANFGFYTPLLDMLLRTRKYKLKKEKEL